MMDISNTHKANDSPVYWFERLVNENGYSLVEGLSDTSTMLFTNFNDPINSMYFSTHLVIWHTKDWHSFSVEKYQVANDVSVQDAIRFSEKINDHELWALAKFIELMQDESGREEWNNYVNGKQVLKK